MVARVYAAVAKFGARDISKAAGKAAGGNVPGQFVMSPELALKLMSACVFGMCSLYFLRTGKRDKNIEKLLWGGFFGLLTALVFGL